MQMRSSRWPLIQFMALRANLRLDSCCLPSLNLRCVSLLFCLASICGRRLSLLLWVLCRSTKFCHTGARLLQIRLPVRIRVVCVSALEIALHFALLVRNTLVSEAYARRHLQRVEPCVVQSVASRLEVVPAAKRADLVVEKHAWGACHWLDLCENN